MSRNIPKRWLKFSRCARIAGTRFIASKTPISQAVEGPIEESHPAVRQLENFPPLGPSSNPNETVTVIKS